MNGVHPSEDWELNYYDAKIANKKRIKPILRKIEKLSPGKTQEAKKNILRRYDTFNNEINESVYRLLGKAFDNRKNVEIGYFNMSSAEVRKREISIYHKTRKYVITYCYLKKAMRKFRTSRIVSAKVSSIKYDIPADFDKNNF